MKYSIFTLFAFLVLSTSCKTEKEQTILLSNPLNIDRTSEVVELKFKDLINQLGELKEDELFLFTIQDSNIITQYIDYENDGLIDEVLLEVSLKAGEIKKINTQRIKKSDFPDYPHKTNIRFAEHKDFNTELNFAKRIQTNKTEVTSKVFLMEGPAWENDKIGFRNYFDLRNGMDIFGKTTSKMALDLVGVHDFTIGAPQNTYGKSYHELNDWGMDILKTGNSLGAGAIALNIRDSLYRIGDNGSGTFKRIFEGPLRSEFSLSFPDWKAAGNIYTIKQNICITAGQYAYKSSLNIKDKHEQEVSFVTGIVNLHSKEFNTDKLTDTNTLFYSFDKQAFDSTYLTLGLVIPQKDIVDYGQTPDKGNGITNTYYVQMKTESNSNVNYWFYAFWERSDSNFTDIDTNIEHIREDILKHEKPILLIKK